MKLSVVIAIFALFVLWIQVYPYSSYSNPFKYHNSIVVTPQVKRGGKFLQKLDVERFRVCDVDITRLMLHIDNINGNILMEPRIKEPGGASEVGRSSTVIPVKVPEDALLGETCMIQRSVSHCVDGIHTTPWPKVCFEIVE